MKKKWLSYIFASALMLVGATSFVLQDQLVNYDEQSQSVMSTYEDTPGVQEVDPVDPPTVDPVDPADPIEQEITYTPKTFAQYADDFEIPTTFAESNVTGSGTQSDPYIINSTEDFIFMGQQSFNSKYIQLNCDIVLNDEIFDEDGNPSGGDGNYYSWQPITGWQDCYVDGKDHTINGVYFNDISADVFSIFCSRLKELKNLKIDNYYAVAKFVCGVYHFNTTRYRAQNLSNVHMLKGTIKASKSASGLFLNAVKVENCTNRANLYQVETGEASCSLAGICVGGYVTEIYDCVNYGNITKYSLSGSVGGIAESGIDIVKNCRNYGEIICESSVSGTYVGGIIAIIRAPVNEKSCEISDCVNYGNMSAQASSSGALCGYLWNKANFTNCKNFGNLYKVRGFVGYGYAGSFYDCVNYGDITDSYLFVGALWNSSYTAEFVRCQNYGNVTIENMKSFSLVMGDNAGNVSILDCKFYGMVTGSTIFRGLSGNLTDKSNMIIKNVEIKMDFDIGSATFYILYSDGTGGTINVSNLTVDTNNVNLSLVNSIWNDSELNMKNVKVTNVAYSTNILLGREFLTNVEIENVIIEEICKFKVSETPTYYKEVDDAKICGVAISEISSQGSVYSYYGSDEDFNDFFSNWRTGKLGLKTMDALGSYYNMVDESLLANKGFVKRTI